MPNQKSQPRYVTEMGVPGCVKGANTVEDLRQYLYGNPHPEYRMVTAQWMPSQNWHIVWERIDG